MSKHVALLAVLSTLFSVAAFGQANTASDRQPACRAVTTAGAGQR